MALQYTREDRDERCNGCNNPSILISESRRLEQLFQRFRDLQNFQHFILQAVDL